MCVDTKQAYGFPFPALTSTKLTKLADNIYGSNIFKHSGYSLVDYGTCHSLCCC